MTHEAQDQLSGEAQRRLVKIFELVSTWRGRTAAVAPVPAVGSSLRKDDEVTDPYQLSHAVIGALVGAVDHLDAVRAFVQDAGILHARAPFTLLRAALENAGVVCTIPVVIKWIRRR